MLSYTDLTKGTLFVKDGEPYEVLEADFLRMQQRKPVMRTKIRNLITGKLYEFSFQPSDQFEKADIEKRPLIFLYAHRGEFVFADPVNKQKRFSLKDEAVEKYKKWLKQDTELTALFFKDRLITLKLPIKIDFKVIEAPPGVQGDRSQSGNKAVTIETGAIIQAPLFINTGDSIRVNTESGEYAERVEKVKT